MKKLAFILFLFSGCGPSGLITAGPQGIPGPMGSPGPSGASCSVTAVAACDVAPNGGALIVCGATQSLVLNGAPGAQGQPGTPGTLVSVLQFCSGTPSYPSVFPEMAFCINNNLYAILDQSNGYDYLTEIIPGEYASETTGLSCDFQIKSNCNIVEN